MFAVPGFSVGNLVVEGSKEQLKKRKADAITTPASTTTTAAITTTTTTTTSTSSTSSSAAAAVLPIAASTSNAPFSKKFKKEATFEKRPPSEPKLGWGWIPEPVPLKERATWNQSTKALRKAKAEEERARKAKEVEDKKQLVSSISGPSSAVELLLKGSVDLTDIAAMGGKKNKGKENKADVEMEDVSGAEPKKRNKRLERKIKRAAYIAAMEANNKSDDTPEATPTATVQETNKDTQEGSGETEGTAENDGGEEVSADGKKKTKKPKILQAPAPKHPELAKLTNKEKRLLKQLQKKQQAEGIDPTSVVVAKQQPLNPSNKRITGQSASDQSTLEAFQAATAAAEEKIMAGLLPKSKKDKKAEKKAAAAAAVVEEAKPVESEKPAKEKKDKKDNTKADNAASKKQQQLAKEREKLLEALARTNSALEELQESLGDEGEDAAPLAKKDVKSAVQDKKKNKKEEAAPTTTKKEKKAAATPAPAPVAPAAKQPKLTKLQEQMKKTLAGGKFRFLNEQLYTTTGEEAFDLFQSKPELFDEYHEGFRSQVELWPQNPVDIFISQLKPMSKDTVIADLGCGDAQISAELPKHNVLSFDLVAKNDRVTACDIAHLPLEDASVDVAIFCLSLMGTDFLKFLREAYRVLKPNGKLKISEVISRFTDVDAFVAALNALGFELKDSDSSNKMFIMFDFIKPVPGASSSGKKAKKGSKKAKVQEEVVDPSNVDLEELDGPSLLKPCIYKKR
ncbi:25S rRNA (adenine645-N1)-methyltransferase [Linnemannia elongata]|nr:25S rRNA (adenine645-N1)-methyltransferase [Linnemannia elongata]